MNYIFPILSDLDIQLTDSCAQNQPRDLQKTNDEEKPLNVLEALEVSEMEISVTNFSAFLDLISKLVV